MKETSSDRRKAENEVYFRQVNERTEESLLALQELATAEGHEDLVPDLDKPIQFFCECSDENCHQRIKIKPSLYRKLRKNSSQFIVIPGHIEPSIERKVRTTKTYEIIEKFIETPSKAERLNPTDVDNA